MHDEARPYDFHIHNALSATVRPRAHGLDLLPARARRRGRRDVIKPPKNEGLRALYDHWRSYDMGETEYADRVLGTSRTNLNNWLNELFFPSRRWAAEIKARTLVDLEKHRRAFEIEQERRSARRRP